LVRTALSTAAASYAPRAAQTLDGTLLELFRRSPDLFCVHALDGAITAVNPAACRALGYTEEQLTSMNLRDVLITDTGFETYVDSVVSDGVASGKMAVRTADGKQRIWQYRNVLTGHTQPMVCGIGRDVTEEEESRQMLQLSERHFRVIAENNPDVIVILDVYGEIRYHSPSALTALQCEPRNILGRRLTRFVVPEDRSRLESAVQRVTGGGAAERIEVSLIRHPAQRRSFEVIVSPLIQRKRLEGVLVNARDITERKMLEQQLEQANRVNSLGHLAATIAHEFNNVLMGMMPFAELLRREGTSPEMVSKSTAHILQSVHRGKRVALDVLRFAQPAEPAMERVELHHWWENFQPEVRARLANHIRLEAFIEPVAVAADPLQLSQFFTNFITNAADAMPSGGRLTVRAEPVASGAVFPFGVVPDSGRFIHISVADTGTGIEPALLQHVFDPLFTTKRNGTGLGLAVTHQIVSRHGGCIFVESTLGVGTTFHIFLPKAQGKTAEAEPVVRKAVPKQSLRMLIVDDEPLIAEGLSAQLEMDGFAVRVAATGADALEDVERFPCDVVVLDIGLPDMDGREVASRLRERHPRLPIILATGHGDSKLVGDDVRMRLLRKPFPVADLIASMGELLAREEA
jgi:PAS domain S-box-containing protein